MLPIIQMSFHHIGRILERTPVVNLLLFCFKVYFLPICIAFVDIVAGMITNQLTKSVFTFHFRHEQLKTTGIRSKQKSILRSRSSGSINPCRLSIEDDFSAHLSHEYKSSVEK
uniref:G_PROTEIN_RECEP_F1_2 domain-containing protein n=1 Tax=Brugia timori TaxID=42155 RepID=A0A0R3QAG9_9BILA